MGSTRGLDRLLADDQDPRLTHGIYTATLVVASGAQSVQTWLILRDSDQSSPRRGDLIALALLIGAFVIAVAVPAIGLWGLLLLLLASPIQRLVETRSKR